MIRLTGGLTLLLGGARSGKSDLALKLGHAWSGEVTFVATATAGDGNMAARIEQHQADRPPEWRLIETPLLGAADVATVEPTSLLIIDCITLLVANLMFAGHDERAIVEHIASLADSLVGRQAPTLVISNEVGLGIHPETELGRSYRDVLGRANRVLADRAATSLFVVAGQILPLSSPEIDW